MRKIKKEGIIMNLTIIENELVPVYQGITGNKYVNARELHEKLEVGRDFTTWIRGKVRKYGFIEGEDFHIVDSSGTLVKSLPQNGGSRNSWSRDTLSFYLTMDMAKEIAMVENNEKGKQVRKYFIAVEKKYREIAEEKNSLTSGQMFALRNLDIAEGKNRVAEGKNKAAQLNALNKILVSCNKMSDKKMDKCIEYAKMLETKTEAGPKQVEEMLKLSSEIQSKVGGK
jgi:phage anti-repressor protein